MIKTVQAKEEVEEIFPLGIADRIKRKLKFFKLNYTDLKSSDNRKLPNWLEMNIYDKNLCLSGTPRKEDIGKIII